MPTRTKKRPNRPAIALAAALLCAAICFTCDRAMAGGVQEVPELGARVDWATGGVRITGAVPVPQKGGATAAKESALALVRRNLRSLLERLGKGGSSVYQIPGVGQVAKLVAMVASARIASAGPVSGGKYQVVITLSLPKTNAVADTDAPAAKLAPGATAFVEPDPAQVRTYPTPPATGEEALLTAADAAGPFTGLIVDARSFHVKSSMSPRLLDAALREVYTGAHAPVDLVEDVGVVGYSGSIAAALRLPRVGARPLVLRAVGVGDVNSVWPVITLPDARRLLAGGSAGIFSRCAVCFITDERAGQ